MRSFIKKKTDLTHRRLDDAFGQLDLAKFDGYAVFLQAHQRAYAALQSAFPAPGNLRSTVNVIHGLIKRDLSALGIPVATPRYTQPSASAHALGVHYVLAGSHFGKRVLLKRWSRSEDSCVRASATYLQSDALREDWPTVLTAFDSMEPDGPLADALAEGALWTFNLFESSLADAKRAHMERSHESA